jgi:DNA polymerase III subunit gamma/tau
MADSRNLSLSRRPSRFADVVGQPRSTGFLAALAQRGLGRSVILHGAVGSGKTTLARLYGRSLNCLSKLPDGSPCGVCDPCETNLNFHEVDVPAKGRQWIETDFETLNRTPPSGWTVFFLDEAHALDYRSTQKLLKNVEEPKPGVVYVLATSEYGSLVPALRSRLFALEIHPFDFETAIQFLHQVALDEGVSIDERALAAIASIRARQPRDLLNALDQMRGMQEGKIHAEHVLDCFGVDTIDRLGAYLASLALGEPQGMSQALDAWNAPLNEKVGWLQDALTAIYYNDVLGLQLRSNGLLDLMAGQRETMVSLFCRRHGVDHAQALAETFRAMLKFWIEATGRESTSALGVQFALFHQLVADAPMSKTAGNQPSPPLHLDDRQGAYAASEGDAGGDRYMRLSDVRELVNRASFLTQEYGVLFNAAFELEPQWFGDEDTAAGVRLVAEFCDDLETDLIGRIGKDSPFAYLRLCENDEMGVRGFVVGHIPDGYRDQLQNWTSKWRAKSRVRPDRGLRMMTADSAKGGALSFHWDAVLTLCAGTDEAKFEGAEPLRRRLSRLDRRQPGLLRGPLWAVSSRITHREIGRSVEEGMAPLSAFDDGVWSQLTSGWELEEYRDRTAKRNSRREELVRLRAHHGSDILASDVAVNRLQSVWKHQDPHERGPRSWLGWWVHPE